MSQSATWWFMEWHDDARLICHKLALRCMHGGAVSLLLYATPPPSRSGPKAPWGGHWRRGGSMVGTDRLNVPAIDTFSH